jgi:23S rRNA-/tRNA-specific pseudouridylate synthase
LLATVPALERCRVFLNGRPAALEDAVEPGDHVDVYPMRQGRSDALEVLVQRDGVLLASKPAGLASETTRQGEDSVVTELLKRLGGGHVHAATRLDAQVSGVVACCLGRDASRRFEEWRERGQVTRTYLAVALGRALPDEGMWSAPLGCGRDRAGRELARVGGRDAVEARTAFRVLARSRGTLLELRPETGRMHQLRAHAAHAGAPLVGDRLYGGASSVVAADGRVVALERIALHCLRLELPGLEAAAPVPEELHTVWEGLGGRREDWPAA